MSLIFAPTVARGGRVGVDFGAGFFDVGGLAVVERIRRRPVVVGVAGEVGDPVVGAGARGGGVEFFGGVVAVGGDRPGWREGVEEVFFGAVGALVEVEGDFAGAVGLIRPESVATSLIFAPTVSEAVASVSIPGLAFLTVVFSPVVEAFAVDRLLLASPEKWAIQW